MNPQVAQESARRVQPRVLSVAVVLALLSAAWSVVLLLPQHRLSLNWDEVDYVQAARQGPLANVLERGSLSIPAYVRFAYEKATDVPPRLPTGYDEQRDPFKLRHGHSPLVVAAMSATASARTDPPQRLVQMAGAVALTAFVVAGYLVIAPSFGWAGLVAILLLLPWVNWHMFRALQFHGWLTVWLCATAVCLVQWLHGGRGRRWGLALCASLALGVVTIESGLFVILAVLVAVVLFVRGRGRHSATPWLRPYVLPGFGIVVLAVVVLWPGFLVKGSVLKIPLERFYQVFGGGDVYYLNRNSGDSLTYPLPALVVAFCLVLLALRHRSELLRWGPLVVVGLVYALFVIKFSVNETYFLPALIPFVLLLGWVTSSLPPPGRMAVVAALALLAAVGSGNVLRLDREDTRADRVRRADFAFVTSYVGTSPAYLDGGHIFRHYTGRTQIADLSFNAKELLVRQSGEYEHVDPRAFDGKVVGILTQKARRPFLASEAARGLSVRCRRTDRPTIVLWDCR